MLAATRDHRDYAGRRSRRHRAFSALEYLPDDNPVWRASSSATRGTHIFWPARRPPPAWPFRQLSSQEAGNSYMTMVTLYELAESDRPGAAPPAYAPASRP
jgi:hypothetical protein